MSEIQNHAEALCAYVNEHVLYDEEMSILDLLDALASCGLTLTDEDTGETSLTYQDLLRPPPSS